MRTSPLSITGPLPITGFFSALVLTLAAMSTVGAQPALAETQIASSVPALIPLKGASTIRAVANAPRTITVTARPGTSIMVSNGASVPIFTRANATGRAVFSRLTPGATYLIEAKNRDSSRARLSVTALAAIGAPARLTAATTDTRSSVRLTWQHTPSRATGGSAIGFRVTATPADSTVPTMSTDVGNVRSAVMSDLSTAVLYSFTVTPRNAAGAGKSTVARMNRTLAQIHGISTGTGAQAPAAEGITEPVRTPAPPAPSPASAPHTTPTTAPANSPAPTPSPPAPPAPPATKTIYVCPDGLTESGDVCMHIQPYTFHEVIETTAYTYSTDSRYESCSGSDCPGSSYVDHGTDWSGTTCPRGGTMHGGQCLGWTSGNKWVNYQVKNAPPLNWYDNGTAYARDVDVRDPMPAGYSDNGTAWVKAVAKIARVVPA